MILCQQCAVWSVECAACGGHLGSPDIVQHPKLTRQRRDLFALTALGILYCLLLAATWQRWTSPIIDHGREMNLPARLLAGERLYVDVHYLYGPLAPHFNALLYQLFGIRLSALHASGAVCGAVILALIYAAARQLMTPLAAGVATATALVVCAVKATASYVMPYSFGALYALVCALAALVCALVYVRRGGRRWLAAAGACGGLALGNKLELALPALAAAGAAWAVRSLLKRRVLWADAALLALSFVAVGATIYGWVLTRVPLAVLLDDNRLLFTNMPPQLYYFNRRVSGVADWPRGVAGIFAGAGLWLGVCGLCALVGRLLSRRSAAERVEPVESPRRPLTALLTGFGVWALIVAAFGLRADASPLTAGTLVLAAVIFFAAWRLWRREEGPDAAPLFVIAVFALASLARVFLNVTVSSPYSPFFLPALVVVYLYVLFDLAPRWLLKSASARARAARVGATLMAVAVLAVAVGTAQRVRRRHAYRVDAPRGTLYTTREIGEPFAAALRWIQSETRPDDRVLVVPQGTSLNFLAARRSPFAEEILLPGFLEGEREMEAISRLDAARVPWVVVEHFPSGEFREEVFGRDYNRQLMGWIEANYSPAAEFRAAGVGGAKGGFGLTVYKLERPR
jgi:hypothetical protein